MAVEPILASRTHFRNKISGRRRTAAEDGCLASCGVSLNLVVLSCEHAGFGCRPFVVRGGTARWADVRVRFRAAVREH